MTFMFRIDNDNLLVAHVLLAVPVLPPINTEKGDPKLAKL